MQTTENSDQTVRMRRLTRVSVGRTSKVTFSYVVAHIVSVLDPHLSFFSCLGRAVLRECGISWLSSLISEPAHDKSNKITCQSFRCPHEESLGP